MGEQSKAQVKAKFADKEYPVHVIGRHIDVTEPMKSYAVNKLTKVDRFGVNIVDVTIIMDIQKLMHSVDFVLNVNNNKIKVSGRTENMYASIDQAVEHLEAKLRRYTARLHEHKAPGLRDIDVNVNVIQRISLLDEINDQIEEENLQQIEQELRPHEVVSREIFALKTLAQDEAIMKMELSEDSFLVYTGEEDQKLKVIYRREDGNYGIIDVQK
ncbi:MAG: Ribosome-associated factor Y [Chlamydiae bacterium]|nr:Ribosome-associated factor Y [Chlamydiota bacterium]